MTLLIMAAGLGTRYGGGGNKQTDGLGPNGEILMQYSVYDAAKAGFSKVVFVIKRSMEESFKKLIDGKCSGLDVSLAVQEFDTLPCEYTPPEGRTRPLGTVHAVLSAEGVIDEPFAVINADDFYGREAFFEAAKAMRGMKSEGHCALISYKLKNTVSKSGGVTRGVCSSDSDGLLTGIKETYEITVNDGGEIRSGDGTVLDPELSVSMNFWCFTPWIFGECRSRLIDFIGRLPKGEMKAEYPLPVMIDTMMKSGDIKVDMLTTEAHWFGVTYQDDKPEVQQKLKELHEAGEYRF